MVVKAIIQHSALATPAMRISCANPHEKAPAFPPGPMMPSG
jgi:hypothetical protein